MGLTAHDRSEWHCALEQIVDVRRSERRCKVQELGIVCRGVVVVVAEQ